MKCVGWVIGSNLITIGSFFSYPKSLVALFKAESLVL